MLNVDKNPFSWNERGNISGQIGGLSLTGKDGSSIPVENLSEDIKVSAASKNCTLLLKACVLWGQIYSFF